ncbi:MAG: DUF488 family protein [Crenarchaeota archaeon]|nr:DUF488 family protein [Thermoproteota archaeon]
MPSPEHCRRILFRRIWFRGLRKDSTKIDDWLKRIAPSHSLRKWYSYGPKKWIEFKKQYWLGLR